MSSTDSTNFRYSSEDFKNSFYTFAGYNQTMAQAVEEYEAVVEEQDVERFQTGSKMVVDSIKKMTDSKEVVDSLIDEEEVSLAACEVEGNSLGDMKKVSFEPSSLEEVILAYKQLVDGYGLHPVRPEHPDPETPSPYGMVELVEEIGDEIDTRQRNFGKIAEMEPWARKLGETPVEHLLEEEQPYCRKAENIAARANI